MYARKKVGNELSSCPISASTVDRRMVIQRKLTIGRPNDKYEQEADRVAEQVMRMPELQVQRQCAECLSAETSLKIDEEEEEVGPKSKGLSVKPRVVTPGIHAIISMARSNHHLLPTSARTFFEARFGHDFGKVRVHADSNAAEVARWINARAFTVGKDIYFGSKQYAPVTSASKKLLAHELTHTIQQSQSSPNNIRRGTDRHSLVALSSSLGRIQRKEGVLKPSVTTENPLERLLKGEADGLTTPFVNGIQISDTKKLDDALPSQMGYTVGAEANTCKVSPLIDILSQAKIITACKPGKNGWTISVPFAIVNKVLGITDAHCVAKKSNIKVRMVASIGNEAYAKLVRKCEGDHEAVVKNSHDKYLKPYHDLVNSKVGSNKDLRKCAEGLAIEFRTKEVAAITDWATDWKTSINKLDGPGGPHTSSAEVKIVGKCAEVLVTIKK